MIQYYFEKPETCLFENARTDAILKNAIKENTIRKKNRMKQQDMTITNNNEKRKMEIK